MLVVHGTKKFLDRVSGPLSHGGEPSSTRLGSWYATILHWKPYVALLVNESTLLPVLMPFAPVSTLINRLPNAVATVLEAHGLEHAFIERERKEMNECHLAKTNSRSILGIMNEFAKFARAYRTLDGISDLAVLSMRLAEIPCSPLYRRHVSPDRELKAFAASLAE